MILSARQLDELHKAAGGNGHIVLPYRARLTPLAGDWVRQKKLALGYADIQLDGNTLAAVKVADVSDSTGKMVASTAPTLWWCQGPCGPAKAAVAAAARQAAMAPIEIAPDARNLLDVVRHVAREIKSLRAAAGILLLPSAARATVLANRCPMLRAIVGTSREAVAEGLTHCGANVLLVEYPGKTLQQISNLLLQVLRGPRMVPEDLSRQLADLNLL